MKLLLGTFAAGASALALLWATEAAKQMPEQVSTGSGNRLRMSVAGHGSPTVVFECFGPANLEIWNRVQPEVARFTRTVSYDHGGYWGSEPGQKPREARQIVHELRGALRTAGIDPPFVLVGYSFGGPYVRAFAGLHPAEVAGLALVDPTQEKFMEWLEKTFPDLTSVSTRHLEAEDELASRWLSLNLARDSILPEMPITLLTGLKRHDPLSRFVMPRWLAEHRAWLSNYPGARHIVTTNSGHDIVLSEPGLVVEAIRQIVDDARAK